MPLLSQVETLSTTKKKLGFRNSQPTSWIMTMTCSARLQPQESGELWRRTPKPNDSCFGFDERLTHSPANHSILQPLAADVGVGEVCADGGSDPRLRRRA